MDLQQKALEAIKKAEGTDRVFLESMKYTITANEPMRGAEVTVHIGEELRRRTYRLPWNPLTQEFEAPKMGLFDNFTREYRDFKISRMTKDELFMLLRKANRRRKSAERKARKLRGKARRINNDALTAIGSRQRTIEEQWKVMRELQRRGLVSTEDLEKVLWDVMKVRRIKVKEE